MTHATLTLMRHAKSSWGNQHAGDHDRTLNDRGNRDAPEMAQRLLDRNSVPDLIMSSTATRTQETTVHLLHVFGHAAPQVHYEKSLYLASPETLLSTIARVPEGVKHLMIVAHNPGIEDLSAILRGVADDTMPTAAIRQFECDSLSSIPASIDALRGSQRSNTAPQDATVRLIYADYPKSR